MHPKGGMEAFLCFGRVSCIIRTNPPPVALYVAFVRSPLMSGAISHEEKEGICLTKSEASAGIEEYSATPIFPLA